MIEEMRREGKGMPFIACRLAPCPSAISRETQPNNGRPRRPSLQAQQISNERQQQRSRCADR